MMIKQSLWGDSTCMFSSFASRYVSVARLTIDHHEVAWSREMCDTESQNVTPLSRAVLQHTPHTGLGCTYASALTP